MSFSNQNSVFSFVFFFVIIGKESMDLTVSMSMLSYFAAKSDIKYEIQRPKSKNKNIVVENKLSFPIDVRHTLFNNFNCS